MSDHATQADARHAEKLRRAAEFMAAQDEPVLDLTDKPARHLTLVPAE